MRTRLCLAAAFLLIAVGVGYFAYGRWFASPPLALTEADRKEEDARRTLAFQSLVARLPTGKPIPPAKPLGADARKRWETLDHGFASSQARRADLLRALHDRTQRFFVDSPGVGSMRDFRLSPEQELMDDWALQEVPDQPGEAAAFPLSPGETLTREEPLEPFRRLHDAGLWGFLNPTSFGLVKDRSRVAGFRPHQFGYRGSPEGKWGVKNILLVGILTQAEPVVYLSDKMPSMELIKGGKTRPVDFFEDSALASLREGQDLVIVRKDDTLRMLGALRATKTCQQCHDAEVGDLLGAFSYTLGISDQPVP